MLEIFDEQTDYTAVVADNTIRIHVGDVKTRTRCPRGGKVGYVYNFGRITLFRPQLITLGKVSTSNPKRVKAATLLKSGQATMSACHGRETSLFTR